MITFLHPDTGGTGSISASIKDPDTNIQREIITNTRTVVLYTGTLMCFRNGPAIEKLSLSFSNVTASEYEAFITLFLKAQETNYKVKCTDKNNNIWVGKFEDKDFILTRKLHFRDTTSCRPSNFKITFVGLKS